MKKKRLLLISAGYASGYNIFGSYFDLFVVSIGGTPFLQSILVSTRNLGNNLLQGLWGGLSDRHGRRQFLALGFLGMAATCVAFIFVRDPLLLVCLVALQVLVGSMSVPAWNGLLGDVTTRMERANVLGFVASVGTLFTIVALLAVGYFSQLVSDNMRQYYVIFIIASVLLVASALVSLSIREDSFVPRSQGRRFTDVLLQDRRFLKFTVAYTVFLMSMALAWPLFSFVTVKVVGATKSQVSIIWASGMVTSYLGQRFGGAITDRLGRRWALFAFFTPLSLTAFCFGIAHSWYWLLAGNVIAGFCTGAGFVAVAVYTLDCASEEMKASYTGTLNLVSGVGTFLASLAGGYAATILSERIGLFPTLRYLFLSVALVRVIAGFAFLKVDETL